MRRSWCARFASVWHIVTLVTYGRFRQFGVSRGGHVQCAQGQVGAWREVPGQPRILHEHTLVRRKAWTQPILHARVGMSATHNSVRPRVTKQQLTIFTGQVCRGAERQCAALGADSRCECAASTFNGAAPDTTNAHLPVVDEDTHLAHAEHTVVLLPNAAFPGGRAAQGQGPPDHRRGVV